MNPPHTTGSSRFLFIVAAFVIVVAGMRAAEAIIVPFLLSAFIAIICAPPLFWFEKHGLPRAVAMMCVILGIIVCALGMTALVGNSINEFSNNLPYYETRINDQVGQWIKWFEEAGIDIPLRSDELLSVIQPGDAIQLVGNLFNSLSGVLANAFLILLTVVFILFETASFPRKFDAIVDDSERTLGRFKRFTDNVKRYLAIKTIASFATGLIITLWLTIIGVDFAIIWGMLAFMLNFVPNIGSIIAAAPAMLFALVQSGVGVTLWVAVGYVITNIVIGSVLEPRYMGRGLGLSTLVVFLSLVFWGWALGPVGMFLSVPLTMMLKIALEAQQETHWIGVLLGSEKNAIDYEHSLHKPPNG